MYVVDANVAEIFRVPDDILKINTAFSQGLRAPARIII